MSWLGWGIQADALAEAAKAEEDVRTWDETVAALEEQWLKDIEAATIEEVQSFFSMDQAREILFGLDADQLQAFDDALEQSRIDRTLEELMSEGKL